MDNLERFLNSDLNEMKLGYVQDKDCYICLLCGKKIEKGIIYNEDGVLYEAEKYMSIHIKNTHESVFEYLINLDKRLTGLSEHQSSLVRLFYNGKSDSDIQNEMKIGSASTIRNHRFILKEKERQAKIFVVMMELLKEKDKDMESGKRRKLSESDYSTSLNEKEKVLKKYLPNGIKGLLTTFDVKEKYRFIILSEIIKVFESTKVYSEKEVNEILKDIYDDYVTLRRYIIEYGLMDRKPDGSEYWLKNDFERKETNMDRKEELKQLYKETKTEAGIYQIRNTKNQKVLVISTPNLKTINGKKFMLANGTHTNKLLQEELNEYGKDAFVIEVLEVLEKKEDENIDVKDALKKLEEKWLDKLQPYGERGYNSPKSKK